MVGSANIKFDSKARISTPLRQAHPHERSPRCQSRGWQVLVVGDGIDPRPVHPRKDSGKDGLARALGLARIDQVAVNAVFGNRLGHEHSLSPGQGHTSANAALRRYAKPYTRLDSTRRTVLERRGSFDLDAICAEILERRWSARKVPFGVSVDEARERVVIGTVQLLEDEREALRLIGGDRMVIDETAQPERR